jgi:drug/metabolite transporter (DMT)-like permease
VDLRNKGLLFVLLTALVSGVSIFANSYAVKGFDSSVFVFARAVAVSLLLLTVIVGLGNWTRLSRLEGKQWLQLAGIGLVGGSIPFLLFFKGLQLTTGTTASFIHKTLFIWAAVLAVLLLREKPSKLFMAGAALLLAGTWAFVKPDFALSTAHLLVLGATLLWAAENVWAKHVLRELEGSVVAFGRMFFGSLFVLVFLLFTGKTNLIVAMSAAQYAWIAVSALLLFLYVFTFYNGLKHVEVSTATAILVLGSPITTTLAWLFRGTPISAFEAAGMVLVLAGTLCVVLSSQAGINVREWLRERLPGSSGR